MDSNVLQELKRIPVILVIVAALLAAGFLVPIVPVGLPEDQWTETEFPAVKIRLERAAEKLEAMALELRGRGPELPETYNLVATRGSSNRRHSLFGTNTVGSSDWTTWAFGTHILPSVPYLIYDHEAGTATITPSNLEPFLEWVEGASSYPGDNNEIQAEQGGAGRPATRSESDSVGGDQPQPQSEGRPQ